MTPSRVGMRVAAQGRDEDAEWARVQELLVGVLGVALEPRVQHEAAHELSSYLVVDVGRIEDPEPRRRHLHLQRVAEALGAVVRLCDAAERLRLNEKQHGAFWARVLCSQMMDTPMTSGDQRIWWFARHARKREIRVKVKLAQRRMEKHTLEKVVAWMDSMWSEHGRPGIGDDAVQPRPMAIAISMDGCELSAKDVELLGSMLVSKATGRNAQERRVFHPWLQALEICHTVLSADVLRALATRAIPRARRIDALRLEDIFPSHPTVDHRITWKPEYISALRSVLTAAVQANLGENEPTACPISISLAYNRLTAAHLHAVYDALRNATRSLRSLSLRYSLINRDGVEASLPTDTCRLLSSIIFCTRDPSDADQGGCELDVSGRPLKRRDVAVVLKTLNDVVVQYFPAIDEAIQQQRTVTCQVSAPTIHMLPDTNADRFDFLSLGTDYVVRNTTNGWICLRNGPLLGWVAPSAITQLKIQDTHVICSRFNRLVLDGDVDQRHADVLLCGCNYGIMLSTLGVELESLSMRYYRCVHEHSLHLALQRCHRLVHLNLQGCSSFVHAYTLWRHMRRQLMDLRSLHLGSTNLNTTTLQSLMAQLTNHPEAQLLELSLAGNDLDASCLDLVQSLLRLLPSLEVVELDGITKAADVAAYISKRRELTREHEGAVVETEALPKSAKLAVLGAFARRGYTFETEFLRKAFDFAGSVSQRHVVWHLRR